MFGWRDFLPLAKAVALFCWPLLHGLPPSLARGGRPVCCQQLAGLLLPAGVEFFRRALWYSPVSGW